MPGMVVNFGVSYFLSSPFHFPCVLALLSLTSIDFETINRILWLLLCSYHLRDQIEIELDSKPAQFLYREGGSMFFMDPSCYEQVSVLALVLISRALLYLRLTRCPPSQSVRFSPASFLRATTAVNISCIHVVICFLSGLFAHPNRLKWMSILPMTSHMRTYVMEWMYISICTIINLYGKDMHSVCDVCVNA